MPNTERTPAPNDKSFDKMRPGGSNSQYNADGTKKSPFKPGVEKKEIDPKKGTGKKTAVPMIKKYNPYGKGATANPSNMSGSTGP